MKKRFIICLNDPTTKEQDKLFIDFIKSKNVGWWHWLTTTWLISDSSGVLTASEIRNELKIFFPNNYNLVFELGEDKDTWSGLGYNTPDKNMFSWIKKNWKKVN